jgi:hypothetical protein
VDIDEPVACKTQDLRAEDASVSHNYPQIKGRNPVQSLIQLGPRGWLGYFQPEFIGADLDRRRLNFSGPPFGSIGLGYD